MCFKKDIMVGCAVCGNELEIAFMASIEETEKQTLHVDVKPSCPCFNSSNHVAELQKRNTELVLENRKLKAEIERIEYNQD